MTTDEVLQAAKEAGFGINHAEAAAILFTRFAALVAAAEREACAELADGQIERWVDDRARYASSECAAAIRARRTP